MAVPAPLIVSPDHSSRKFRCLSSPPHWRSLTGQGRSGGPGRHPAARVSVPLVVAAPARERPDPDLAEQVIGGLLTRPAGEEPVDRDLVTLHNLDKRVGAAPHGPLDQHAVGVHAAPSGCPLPVIADQPRPRSPHPGGYSQRLAGRP